MQETCAEMRNILKETTMVSIIMGVYNIKNKDQFRQALESVRNQSYSSWELIVCDDGSTNDTRKQLQQFAKKDSRIRVIGYDTNQGLAHALNVCIQCAKGKYIARMDADDICLPERIQRQVDFLEKHKDIHFVGTAAELIDDTGVWGQRVMPEKPEKKTFLFRSPFIHPTVMFCSEILQAVGGYRVAKETRRAEDYDLFMRLYAFGYQGYNLSERLYQFREDGEALGRKKYRYRIDEMRVRWRGFQKLGLLPGGILYVIKPLIVGLIPYRVLVWMRNDKAKR